MAQRLDNISIKTGSLLSSTARVESPFVRVTIGGYTFGVYEGKRGGVHHNGLYSTNPEKFPEFVKSLEVKKVNGTINTYTLVINYPITANDDPNFFEKLFGSVSETRKIGIHYGDHGLLNYIYKDEEAIITNITTQFDIQTSVITYNIKAVSASKLALTTTNQFPAYNGKPSDKIKWLFEHDSDYHLMEIFSGMKNKDLSKFIDGTDREVSVDTVSNVSVLDYISKLVSYMVPGNTSNNSVIQNSVYTVTTFEDTTGEYGGPYLKVQKVPRKQNNLDSMCTYTVDIGYPTSNIITSFNLNTDNNWGVYYNYNMNNKNSDFITRINDNGETVYEYSPMLSGSSYNMKPTDLSWWTKVTEFPIKAKITLKGMLKPAILCTYIKLNVWFYGRKHTSSGYYIITEHTDSISESGYFTTLGLTRVGGEDYIGD